MKTMAQASPKTSQPEEPLQPLVCLILFLTHFSKSRSPTSFWIDPEHWDWDTAAASSNFRSRSAPCACKLWFATIRTEWTGNCALTRTGISMRSGPGKGSPWGSHCSFSAGEGASCQIWFLSIGPELIAQLNFDKWQVSRIKMTGDGRWLW